MAFVFANMSRFGAFDVGCLEEIHLLRSQVADFNQDRKCDKDVVGDTDRFIMRSLIASLATKFSASGLKSGLLAIISTSILTVIL
jgi:hypothetical protein